MSFMMSAFLITWLAIALLAFAMSGLVRQVHALASSQQAVPFRTGPPIGAVLPDLNGAFPVSHPTRPTVLLFSEATCSTCAELLPERMRLDDWGYPIVSSDPIPRELEGHARRA